MVLKALRPIATVSGKPILVDREAMSDECNPMTLHVTSPLKVRTAGHRERRGVHRSVTGEWMFQVNPGLSGNCVTIMHDFIHLIDFCRSLSDLSISVQTEPSPSRSRPFTNGRLRSLIHVPYRPLSRRPTAIWIASSSSRFRLTWTRST
jgi:hypothetical protein